MDLEIVCYNISTYSKELDALSNENLQQKINKQKKPWWNSLYRKYLYRHTRRLLIIFLLFIRKDYSKNGQKLIWKILKAEKSGF